MRRCFAPFLFGLGLVLTLSVGEAPGGGKDDKKGDKKADKNDGVGTNWGEPKNCKGTEANGFWLWYDDGIWHIRTTGKGKGAHRFDGKIEVAGGDLINLKGKTGEYKGGLSDRYVFNRNTI